MSALEQLAAKIAQARALGFLSPEWDTLAQAAVAEVGDQWLSERAFRQRSGSSDKWCRHNFGRCAASGLARRDARGRREWHVHARLPRASGRDVAALKREIVESFSQRAAS